MIMAVQMIQADDSWRDNETLWEDTTVTAQECSLQFCINAYDTKIEKDILKESVIDSWTDRTPNSYKSTYNDVNNELYEAYTNYTLDHWDDSERTDLQLFIPPTENPDTSKLEGKTFNITLATVASMVKFFTQDFAGKPT